MNILIFFHTSDVEIHPFHDNRSYKSAQKVFVISQSTFLLSNRATRLKQETEETVTGSVNQGAEVHLHLRV